MSMPARSTPTPAPVRRALALIGQHLADWRRLQRLTAAQVADRAGVAWGRCSRMEKGADTNFENVLRVARALGLLDRAIEAFDPAQTDLGRARSLDALPKRVRPRRDPE